VSYELSAGLAIMTIVVFSGSLNLNDIIASQQDGWWIFKGHIPVWIAFVIFIIAVTAETNRAPFDLAEAESELTAGFHTEYSGMKFALFFLAEYAVVLWGMDAFACGTLGSLQPHHGLYSLEPLVLWEDIFPDLFDHVVPLDLPTFADRPATEPGMEIFITDQHGEYRAHHCCGFDGVAFLISNKRYY
jgi:hypothetical protein